MYSQEEMESFDQTFGYGSPNMMENSDSLTLKLPATAEMNQENSADSDASDVPNGQKYAPEEDFDMRSPEGSFTEEKEGLSNGEEYDMRSPKRNPPDEKDLELKSKILGDIRVETVEEYEEEEIESEAEMKNCEGPKGRSVTGTILMEISKKEKIKKKLEIEVEGLNKDIKTVEEDIKKHDDRVVAITKKVNEQEEELTKQSAELAEGKILEKKVNEIKMRAMEKGLDEANGKVEELKYNVGRLYMGKKEKVLSLPKSETLKMLMNLKEQVAIFCPGNPEGMSEGLQEELLKVETIQRINYGEVGVLQVVEMMMEYGEEGAKGALGIIVLWLHDSLISRNKKIEASNVEDYMDMLRIMTNGSGRRFKNIIFVIPPSKGSDMKALEVLASKVTQIQDKNTGMVNLLKKQREMGEKMKEKKKEVWKAEEKYLARIFRTMEDDGEEVKEIGLNEYSFRRCLSEVAMRFRKNEGKCEICERCGDIHGEVGCEVKSDV